jgi:putative glycosyltransferase (TIGR04348 family)
VHRSSIVIVTPALAAANNGNWQTARRWARLLGRAYRIDLTDRWEGGAQDCMIALHARRSAPSMQAWRQRAPGRPLVLALTGTDLYRDIDTHPEARAWVADAERLVVLNTLGARRLPADAQARAVTVLQSCGERQPLARSGRHLRALMVGHLRDEKDPLTYLRAARRLAGRADIRLDHVGAPLDADLGAQAAALDAAGIGYRWLGERPHEATRRRIQAAHVLVHASRMEGGAHVVIEAMRSGTPVIASRIDGNLGLLGEDHPALFEPGDDAALAALLERARDEPDWLRMLTERSVARSPRFSPEAESRSLLDLLAALLPAAAPARPG